MNNLKINRITYSFILLFWLELFIASCSIKTSKEFYVLSYLPQNRDISARSTVHKYPLPYKIEVPDFDINRVYDRNSIIVRQSLHKLSFEEKEQWAYRPHKAMTELMINHLNQSGLFVECRNYYLDDNAQYIVSGRLNNIEKYQSELFNFAYIDFDVSFMDRNNNVLVTKHVHKDIQLENEDTAYYAKVVSDLLKKEFSAFIEEIFEYFENNSLKED